MVRELYNNTIGIDNTATGYFALANNTTGSGNIALGNQAGFNLTVGNNNIDIGNSGVAAESGIIRIGTDGTHTNTFLSGAVNLNGSLILQGKIQVPGAGIDTNQGRFHPPCHGGQYCFSIYHHHPSHERRRSERHPFRHPKL
jgi:hypothetical protein